MDESTFSRTERNLFALFVQYPELKSDPERENLGGLNGNTEEGPPHSSPESTSADGYDQSNISADTVDTTPLRPLRLVQQPQSLNNVETVAGYMHAVCHTDLPEGCRLCFSILARNIGIVSTGLASSSHGRCRINNTFFTDRCSGLLLELKHLSQRTKEQATLANGLTSLVIFRAVPSDEMLWSTYRQRAQLIIRSTKLPSSNEYRLVEGLAHLYNTSIYRPAQILLDNGEIEPASIELLNGLYDTLFTWTSDYRFWCKSMSELKEHYMAPLVERMMQSRAMREDVSRMQQAKKRAEVAIANPVGPSMLPMDERVLKELNLSARRKAPVIRRKNRFRREKTI